MRNYSKEIWSHVDEKELPILFDPPKQYFLIFLLCLKRKFLLNKWPNQILKMITKHLFDLTKFDYYSEILLLHDTNTNLKELFKRLDQKVIINCLPKLLLKLQSNMKRYKEEINNLKEMAMQNVRLNFLLASYHKSKIVNVITDISLSESQKNTLEILPNIEPRIGEILESNLVHPISSPNCSKEMKMGLALEIAILITLAFVNER